MKRLYFLLLLLLMAGLISCEKSDDFYIEQFNRSAENLQERFAPDPSLNRFTATLDKKDGRWQVAGESTRPKAEEAVRQLADSLLGENQYQLAFTVLPEPALKDSSYGLIRVSVANLREKPSHAAQLIDQAIMGDRLRLLKEKGYWYLIQTHYGYIGWMTRASFHRTDQSGVDQWMNAKRVRCNKLHAMIYEQPNAQSIPVSDLTLNGRLQILNKGTAWSNVKLVDGREGFIKNDRITMASKQNPETSAKAIIQTAKQMMGVPYLWGGNSSKGNDCSGFTQTVFFANGVQLPRDARQQVHKGQEIDWKEDFANVHAGDLLFFGSGERITHVGISLGGPHFIHQDSWVHIDSFDEDDENFNPYRKRTLKVIKRILK